MKIDNRTDAGKEEALQRRPQLCMI